MLAAQIIAAVIFVLMFVIIILDKFERHYVTLVSGALMIIIVFGICMHSMQAVIDLLNVQSIFTQSFWYGESSEQTSGINWSTIIFIAGMMVMVEGMGQAGFFRWLCLRLAKFVHYRAVPLLICFMFIAACLSMFIDSITVILFLAVVTTELAALLKFDPVPMILAEIFCANLGGAATMCGDPPNIIIGTSLGLSFFDFITNTGLIAAFCFAAVVLYFWLSFRKELSASDDLRKNDEATQYPQPSEAITNRAGFFGAAVAFLCVVALLVTHAQTTLSVALIGVIAASLAVLVTLISEGPKKLAEILKKVDYKTLLFFIGLFISVSGLEQSGVLELVAAFIGTISGGSAAIVIIIILWLSAFASALVDNIPFSATMVPVIQSISGTMGIDIKTLAWALSLGTDLGGNATPIGASANVVGTSIAAHSGHPIGWGKYCRYCIPATVIVVLISMLSIFVIYL